LLLREKKSKKGDVHSVKEKSWNQKKKKEVRKKGGDGGRGRKRGQTYHPQEERRPLSY